MNQSDLIVIKCKSEYDLMKQFSIFDDFNPEDKFLILPEYLADRYYGYYDEPETDQQGLHVPFD